MMGYALHVPLCTYGIYCIKNTYKFSFWSCFSIFILLNLLPSKRGTYIYYVYTHIFFVKVSLHEYTKIVDTIKSKFSTCFLFCVYFFKKISQAANLYFKTPKKTLKSIVHDRYSCSNPPSCLFFETLFTMKNWWS